MGAITSWDNLPLELVSVIAHKVDCLDSLKILSAVCKSWNSAVSELKLLLPPKDPWLLLAEDSGLDFNSVLVTELEAMDEDYIDDNNNVDVGDPHANNNNDEGDNNNDIDNDPIITSNGVLFQNISSLRGFYSLARQKIYHLDLPEAAGRIILGTNKGCLVTLGRDLQINLLHPLMRYQIPLPPMLTLPCQYEYHDDFQAEEVYTMFLVKVVMSSQVLRETQDTYKLPTIMAIYGQHKVLGFARLLVDKKWKPVETDKLVFHDIVFHKAKFYAIDMRGTILMCDVDKDDKREGQIKGIQVTSIPIEKEDSVQSYLIESLFGSHLWVVLRFRQGEYYEAGFRPPTAGKLRYYTSCFLVFKLEIQSTNFDIPSREWSGMVKDVGNEALFIGRNSSVSIAASEFIKPNSIYFTDDGEFFRGKGGGHDMGIFNIENDTIEPHFPGTSIHPFTPPVWYI